MSINLQTQQQDTKAPPTQQHQQTMAALQYTKSILGQPITCTLDDGRTVQGKFLCMDRLQNIILTDVVERRSIQTSDYRFEQKTENDSNNNNSTSTTETLLPVQRHLGQAMVPGSRLVKVEIAESIHHKVTEATTTSAMGNN